MTNFYNRGSLGDIIYSLPTIKEYGKSNLILKNKHYYSFLNSLLNAQDYINEVKHLEDGKTNWSDVNINLDQFRTIHKKNLSKPLVQCFSEILNFNNINYKNPWLFNIKKNKVKPIIINRTLRYHDKEDINWHLFKSIENKCIFIGSQKEHFEFSRLFNLNIDFFKTENAIDVASVINGCDLFVGNQSFCYSLAESLKVDRVLEVCFEKPNCGPLSENGFTSEKLEQVLLNKNFFY